MFKLISGQDESLEPCRTLKTEMEMQMNGNSFKVKAGDAVLTRPGSSHGLKVIGDKDLTIIINYEKH